MPSWLLLLVLSLGTFRLTRLVTRDDFPPIAWLRLHLQAARPPVDTYHMGVHRVHYDDGTGLGELKSGKVWDGHRWWWLGELVSCHWCCSAYISAGLVGLTVIFTSVPVPVFTWLAVWGAGAILVDRLG